MRGEEGYLSPKADPILVDKHEAAGLVIRDYRNKAYPFKDDPHYQSLKTREEKAAYAREVYEKNVDVPEDPDPVFFFGSLPDCEDSGKPLPDELGVVTLWERNQKRKLNGTEYLPNFSWRCRDGISLKLRCRRKLRLMEKMDEEEANRSEKKLKLDQQEEEEEEEEEEQKSLPTTTTSPPQRAFQLQQLKPISLKADIDYQQA